jgi:steroid delta-isomerase-like uncharacterized protein
VGETVASKNKELVTYYLREVHENRRLEVIDEVFSEDWVDRATEELHPEADASRHGLHRLIENGFRIFPDRKTVVEDIIAEGDRVVVRSYVTGTHTGGEYLGVPPTGKVITNRMIVIHRVEDGKVVETWGGFDQFGVMQQMGVLRLHSPT